ncbi:MAG: SprB repeat-containing protein [Crocinitomicaceae bacterium]|nr:SprB repeat-containing protein [Crocinitomicaceae bacterium]
MSLNETVSNSAGTLQIDNAVLTQESCGNSNGAINLIVSGGTPAYTYTGQMRTYHSRSHYTFCRNLLSSCYRCKWLSGK